jgi:hypothetical protein
MALDNCAFTASLINQDPYPAIPGDYVKLVFQVSGVEDANCEGAKFEVTQNYPFSLDLNDTQKTLDSSTWTTGFNSFWNVPYNVRIDNNAMDGDAEIEVRYGLLGTQGGYSKKFNITIKDSRSDFEVFVKDYKPTTKIMTLEVLNIGENDVRALTLEIPNQDHIKIKGPSRNIVGDLDSNEYSTADFEIASGGGNIEVNILYTDNIHVRRNLTKTLIFEPLNFENRAADKKSSPVKSIVIIVIIIAIGIYFYRRYKRRKIR